MSGRWTLLKKFAWGAALALTLGSMPASAHHSMAMFDAAKEVTISGTVKQFQWTNPHSYIQLNVRDSNGRVVEWSLELGAPMYLYAKGWRPRTLKAGDPIVVKINPLRSGQPGGAVLGITTPDGKKLGNLE
jgi:hypothetical protein